MSDIDVSGGKYLGFAALGAIIAGVWFLFVVGSWWPLVIYAIIGYFMLSFFNSVEREANKQNRRWRRWRRGR
jgi:hypothetical protein